MTNERVCEFNRETCQEIDGSRSQTCLDKFDSVTKLIFMSVSTFLTC